MPLRPTLLDRRRRGQPGHLRARRQEVRSVRPDAEIPAAAGEERGQPGARRRIRRARPAARVPHEVVAGERIGGRAVDRPGRDRIGLEAEVAQRPHALVDGGREHRDPRHALDRLQCRQRRGGHAAERQARIAAGHAQARHGGGIGREHGGAGGERLPARGLELAERDLGRQPVADQPVQGPHRRRRVQLERVAVGRPGLDAAGQPARLVDPVDQRRERGVARDRHHVGAPEVAVAPRGGRRVEDRDPIGDVDPDPQCGVGQPAARLVHPDDVRALRERLALERVVLLELGHLDVVEQQPLDQPRRLRVRALARVRAGSRRPSGTRASSCCRRRTAPGSTPAAVR